MEDNLAPAIDMADGLSLTPEEFQRMLYDYFEERGILCDLRAHLRKQMINVLKDTSLGKMLINKNKEMSPKLQALNLIVAEYLLQKGYHYSLSVFTTEVPLSSIFPNFSSDLTKPNEICTFRFSESDMWDILETLGFLQTTNPGKSIALAYNIDTQESLLNCMVRSVAKWKEANKIVTNCIMQNSECNMNLEHFVNILQEYEVAPNITLKILEHLNSVVTNEVRLIKECKETEFDKIKQSLEDEANRKLDKYKKKLINMEANFSKEQNRLEIELETAKNNLKDCAKSLQTKYADVKKFEDGLMERDKKMSMKEDALKEREAALQKREEETVEEKLKYLQQRNDERVQKEEKGQQTFDTVNLENALLKQNVCQLQMRIETLTQQNDAHLVRIQEFAIRTNSLMAELEESRQRTQQMNGMHRSQLFAAPLVVPSVPTITYRPRSGVSSYNGGGEEGSPYAPFTGRQFRNINKDVKRRTQRKPPNQSTSSSEEHTRTTDTVLKETKQRLLNLEIESEKIDEQYQKFVHDEEHAAAKPPHEVAATASGILHDFRANVSTIRQSLSRLFGNKECHYRNEPSTSSQLFAETMPDVVFQRSDDDGPPPAAAQLKIQNLIAEVPENLDGAEYAEVVQSLEKNDVSRNSSALLLATSFSTVELSEEVKTDSDDLATGRKKLTESALLGVWDNVGISCLLAFFFEMFLFK